MALLSISVLVLTGWYHLGDVVSKIKPEVFLAVGDAVTAAETAYEADSGVDKYAVAFAAAAASLEKDGVTFAESEINYAIETFVQARSAALSADAQTAPAAAVAPVSTEAPAPATPDSTEVPAS
jgi:hypothetical protein